MQGSLRSLLLGVWAGWCLAGFLLLQGPFLSPGVNFVYPGATFWVLRVALGSAWGPRSPSLRFFLRVRKMKRLGSLIESVLGHILKPLPPKIERASVLLRSFVSFFSNAFLAVFRSDFLEAIVESRRRPMCVWHSKNLCFHKISLFDSKRPGTAYLMILSSILEAFWGPGLFTFCFFFAPVTNACMFFGSQLTSLIISVKSDVEESRNGCGC